jgi:hypothetical protein
VEYENPSREGQLTRNVAVLAMAAALALGWSSAAQSRTQNDVDCFANAEEKMAESLHVSPIDHMPIPSASKVTSPDAVPAEETDASAPLLDLTPRAASTLRDVFEAVDYVESAEPVVESRLSSIAETEDLPDISELPDNSTPVAPVDADIDLPLLQRQMFRTDI